MRPLSRVDETLMWSVFAALFPLFVYPPGYDSFHEPKWLLWTGFVGIVLLLRAFSAGPLLQPRTPLDLPAVVFLLVSFLALRWRAGDREVALLFWSRLIVAYLSFRLLTTWLLEVEDRLKKQRIRRVLNGFLIGGSAIAVLAVLQDWNIGRWSHGPVSDWRFHLSSTLGNPNEVGGYLSYLLPCLLARWFATGNRKSEKMFVGILGVLYLYALTTVFTVGAWLGLLVVLPPAVVFWGTYGRNPQRTRFFAPGIVISLALLALLQGTLRLADAGKPYYALFFFVSAGAIIPFVYFLLRRFLPEKAKPGLAALLGLLVVWTLLLLPWKIPNHPEGLVREAVGSPRWKGGFGARRFIWRTTGLMIKDHPVRGIGWGHYYTVHALYQGEVYRQRGLPHDRPTVGLVPQAHSDPLQVIAEGGFLAGTVFFWLAGTAIFPCRKRGSRKPNDNAGTPGDLWSCRAGLGIIGFHSLVDFPLRQPQPVFLSLFFLAVIATSYGAVPGTAGFPFNHRVFSKGSIAMIGISLFLVFTIGIRDQASLKSGFETYQQALVRADPEIRTFLLEKAAAYLDSIRFPLPETHERWIYRARVSQAQGDFGSAKQFLEKAARYRHSLMLYRAWYDLGMKLRDPRLALGAVRGLLLYNPCWAGYHREAARLERILGNENEAEAEEKLARCFSVSPIDAKGLRSHSDPSR